MRCPFCRTFDSRVIDTRLIEEGAGIRRRRECVSCRKRFTTYERYDGMPLMVIKKDNRREPFDRKKIEKGLVRACNKRSVSSETIASLVESIEQEARKISNTEIDAVQVGKIVMEKLREVDEVAYLRFASVYKEFKEVSSFIREAKELESS